MGDTTARVRGIYATALTRLLLDEGVTVVDASPPIRRRFSEDFPVGNHDATVETTRDREGIGIHGLAEVVDTLVEPLGSIGIDAMTWQDPTPRGAIYDGQVTSTRGSGAVVELEDGNSGYLPFDATADYVEEDDIVRVQVSDPRPPWDTDLPGLDTTICVHEGLATLVQGAEGVQVAGMDESAGRELAGVTDLLETSVPDGWGLRWRRGAVEADLEALAESLKRARRRVETVAATLETASNSPKRLAAPMASAWIWFGRESRVELDETRRTVTTTMPGHHRTKAASDAASAGVDFVEALCDPTGEFPFEVVTEQFGPQEGDSVAIQHGKPDGRVLVLGHGTVTGIEGDGTVKVRRSMTAGGEYDALGVPKEAGDVAVTTFREGRWWYPTVYQDADDNRKGTYVNICTPVEAFPSRIRYLDLEVDVIKHVDGTVERVDDDELTAAVEAGHISPELAEKARTVAAAVERALN